MVQVTQDDTLWTMSLGDLINALHNQDMSKPIYLGVKGDNPDTPRSYRGYYDHLAIGTCEYPKTVGHFLAELERANGKVYYGYKGGEYAMQLGTPIWASEYGSASGIGIVSVMDYGAYVLMITKEID